MRARGEGGYMTEAKSDCLNTLDKTPVVWLKLMGQARILNAWTQLDTGTLGSRRGLAVSGPTAGRTSVRFRFRSPLFKSCGLWTLSCDFVRHI